MRWLARGADRADKVLHGVVVTTLFAMMIVTFVDVCGRYFLGLPLPAAYEMTELLMAITIFGAMPSVTLKQGHITISLFDRFFSPAAARVRRIAVSLFCSVGAFALAYQVFLRGQRMLEQSDYTMFLQAPLAPFAFFIAAMSAVMGGCFLLVAAGGKKNRADGSSEQGIA